MKSRTSFCAFTKFKKLCTVRKNLRFTNKTVHHVHQLVDTMLLKLVHLVVQSLHTKKHTINVRDLHNVLRILSMGGVHLSLDQKETVTILPRRLGHHVLKQIDQNVRLSKDAQPVVRQMYVSLISRVLDVLAGEELTGRISSDTVSRVMKQSYLKQFI